MHKNVIQALTSVCTLENKATVQGQMDFSRYYWDAIFQLLAGYCFL